MLEGTLRSAEQGTKGVAGNITVASLCGDIHLGPQAWVEAVGQDFGGSDITLVTCGDRARGLASGDITIEGLVEANYKVARASQVQVVSFDGGIDIDGNNLLGVVAGTQTPQTSGCRCARGGTLSPGCCLETRCVHRRSRPAQRSVATQQTKTAMGRLMIRTFAHSLSTTCR